MAPPEFCFGSLPKRREAAEPMSDSSAYLSQEVIRDILIRLPVKSIGRSRCVSKPWRSLLTSTEFIRSHLDYQTLLAKEQNLLLLSSIPSPSQSLFTLNLHPDSRLSKDLKPRFKEKIITLVGSCNGLVLVVTEGNCVCLINPTTLEYAKLPNSPLALDPSTCVSMHGFGYDSLSDDYKIVTLSNNEIVHEHGCNVEHDGHCYCDCDDDDYDTFVDIYSVKMRSWRRFGSSPSYYAYTKCVSGAFVNGALHWICWKCSRGSSLIAAFDLGSEKLEEIPAPASLDKAKLLDYELVVVDGCLGIVAELNSGKLMEVCFMNSYGLAESWTKITIDVQSVPGVPLCFFKDKILWEDCENFRWHYPDDGRWDDWMASGDKYEFVGFVTFSESLVSPQGEL